jgi:phosphohistidine phosphatase
MKVYFLRHGLAGDAVTWRGDDGERPLTSDGIEKMKRETQTMARLELEVDAIVTSPLVRARQTAEIAAQGLGLESKLVVDKRVGIGFSFERLREVLTEHPDVRSLMFVGHEPSMSETIGALTGARVEMKKGALACVETDRSARRGTLLWLLPPKVLSLSDRVPSTVGLETDDPGVGRWQRRESLPDGARLAVTFTYPDRSNTTATGFQAIGDIPGVIPTEAGTFAFDGDSSGGEATFASSAEYRDALRALGQRVFAREMLACGVFQVPLVYMLDVLTRWPKIKIILAVGMHMAGVTRDNIANALSENPMASPEDVITRFRGSA